MKIDINCHLKKLFILVFDELRPFHELALRKVEHELYED